MCAYLLHSYGECGGLTAVLILAFKFRERYVRVMAGNTGDRETLCYWPDRQRLRNRPRTHPPARAHVESGD